MAYRVRQTNKKNGVTYVYDVVSVWHKELGQSRNKQVCVGKLDPVTGEFIPSKRLDPQQAAVRDPAVTRDSDKIGHVIRVKTAGSSDANRPPRRSEATLAF